MTYVAAAIERPFGKFFLYAQDVSHFSEKPLVLLLHGAFEKHKKLLAWADLWAQSYDVALADLPGHGQSDAPSSVTMESYIEELRWLVGSHFERRSVVIVGDSFGGLLGIALGNSPPANLRAVVALDPLLSTAKQWSILDLMPRILEGQPHDGFRHKFAANVMGMAQRPPEDRRYYSLVEGAKIPAMVLTGAESLGVRREVTSPSLLDDDDREFLAEHVDLVVIPGVGHQLVLQRPAETFAAAERFIATL